MKAVLVLMILFLAIPFAAAGPEVWLQGGLIKPEVIRQLKTELQLTAEQDVKINAIITEAQVKGAPLEKSLLEQQKVLTQLLRDVSTTSEAASTQLTQVLELEASLKQLQLRTLLAVRDLLTAEQKKKALTLGAPKVVAQVTAESQFVTKVNKVRGVIESLGGGMTSGMRSRYREIESLVKSGDMTAAEAALDQLIEQAGINEPADQRELDFSTYEPGETDEESLVRRFDAVKTEFDKIVSIPLYRKFMRAKRAFDAAAKDEDPVRAGRILSWAEQVLKINAARKSSQTDKPARPVADSKPEAIAVTSGPRIVKAADLGVGRMIADVRFKDLRGSEQSLSKVQGPRGLVIAMTSATCPVSKRYLPTLAALERKVGQQGFTLLLVNSLTTESTPAIESQLKAAEIRSPYVIDTDKALISALAARTTAEVFLLDEHRTLIYRGAVDDQYGVNYSLDAPHSNYLDDAIAALLKRQQPQVRATEAPGCEIDLPNTTAAAPSVVTYHRDVNRILQQNCLTCHRDGGVAPFSLEKPEQVQERVKTIERVVREGTMPPWFAAPVPANTKNPWANDTSLSLHDKADLLAWLRDPQRQSGDPDDSPAPVSYPGEWTIGKPDYVVQLPQPFTIKATGVMPYQFAKVETTLQEDRWVQAYEILPTDRSVVHHVLVEVHTPGKKVKDRGEHYWAIYVPGNGSHRYPRDFARKLPARSTLTFQIHYTPSGQATTDQLKLGLIFAEQPPRYIVETAVVSKQKLAIPPGAANHVETYTLPVPTSLTMMGFVPHMHVRGKAFKYELLHADGRAETLLDVPRYDFNWQLYYELAEPKPANRGMGVRITAAYDNSADNKANPDPTKLVKWGQQTEDEMMVGYVEYYTANPEVDMSPSGS